MTGSGTWVEQFSGRAELQRPPRQVQPVRAHVGQVAVAELQPRSPIQAEAEVVVLERQDLRRAAPEVPVQLLGNRVGLRVVVPAGRTTAVHPHVDFANLAQHAGLDDFHAAAEGVGGAALRADLGDQLGELLGQFADLAGLGAAMGQRLLAEDVLAGQQGPLAHGDVPALAGSDHHRVERLFLVQQLAIVLVDLGLVGYPVLGEFLLGLGDLALIDVADGHDVFAAHASRKSSRARPPQASRPMLSFLLGAFAPNTLDGTICGNATAPTPAAAACFSSVRRVIWDGGFTRVSSFARNGRVLVIVTLRGYGPRSNSPPILTWWRIEVKGSNPSGTAG